MSLMEKYPYRPALIARFQAQADMARRMAETEPSERVKGYLLEYARAMDQQVETTRTAGDYDK